VGISYDLYSPSTDPTQTFIMVYGLDYAGEKDPRIIKFAAAYASNGFQVAIPDLPGLKSLSIETNDIKILCVLAKHLHHEFGQPVGFTSFSIGGGLSLVAAANIAPELLIDPILLFSPHYSIMDLWEEWQSRELDIPTNDRKLEHYIWNKMALAYRGMDRLSLSKEEKAEFLTMLFNYCAEPSLEKKKQDYARLFSGREIPGYGDFPIPEPEQKALSPLGKLSKVKGRVLILHDINDLIIPPSHSSRIIDELQLVQDENSQNHRLLITPLLSHVTVNNSWRVLDVFPILDIIGEIFTPSNLVQSE
jgi:hypothetical protein